jgi:hypothetical protein
MLRLPVLPRPQIPPFSRSHFPPPLSRLRPYPHNRRPCRPVRPGQHYSDPSATPQQHLPVPAPLWRKSPSAAARPPLLSAGPPQNGNFTTQSQLRSRRHYDLLCTYYHLNATSQLRSPRYLDLIPNSRRANLHRQNGALAPTLRRCLSGRPCESPGPTASHSCPAQTSGPAARHTPKARSDVYPHIRLVHPAAGPLNILRTFSRANSPPCKIPGPPLPISTLPCALQVSHRFSPLPLCQRCASPASGAPILCTTLFTSPNMPYPVQASTKLARSARKQPPRPPH